MPSCRRAPNTSGRFLRRNSESEHNKLRSHYTLYQAYRKKNHISERVYNESNHNQGRA